MELLNVKLNNVRTNKIVVKLANGPAYAITDTLLGIDVELLGDYQMVITPYQNNLIGIKSKKVT